MRERRLCLWLGVTVGRIGQLGFSVGLRLRLVADVIMKSYELELKCAEAGQAAQEGTRLRDNIGLLPRSSGDGGRPGARHFFRLSVRVSLSEVKGRVKVSVKVGLDTGSFCLRGRRREVKVSRGFCSGSSGGA